jgi:hypothetical protein
LRGDMVSASALGDARERLKTGTAAAAPAVTASVAVAS